MTSASRESGSQPSRSCLESRLFYALIVLGVILGAAVCAAMGWFYLESSAARPSGRRIWDGVADQFVIPICAMVGATFGGLLGLTAAIALDSRVRCREHTRGARPDVDRGDVG